MNKKRETHLKVADSLDKPRSNSPFKSMLKDTGTIAGGTLLGLLLLGNTSKTYGQTSVRQGTEQSGKQDKLSWGELKAKFGPTEKKAAEKTWIEKETPGAKKYDVDYNDGVLTFKKLNDGKDFSFSLIKDVDDKIIRLAETPLLLIWHTTYDGVYGICLGYDKGMLFVSLEKAKDGNIDVNIIVLKSDNRLSMNSGSR